MFAKKVAMTHVLSFICAKNSPYFRKEGKKSLTRCDISLIYDEGWLDIYLWNIYRRLSLNAIPYAGVCGRRTVKSSLQSFHPFLITRGFLVLQRDVSIPENKAISIGKLNVTGF
jgi:hypothetical protein